MMVPLNDPLSKTFTKASIEDVLLSILRSRHPEQREGSTYTFHDDCSLLPSAFGNRFFTALRSVQNDASNNGIILNDGSNNGFILNDGSNSGFILNDGSIE